MQADPQLVDLGFEPVKASKDEAGENERPASRQFVALLFLVAIALNWFGSAKVIGRKRQNFGR